MARAERAVVSGTAPASYSCAALPLNRPAKVKIFETAILGRKERVFERPAAGWLRVKCLTICGDGSFRRAQAWPRISRYSLRGIWHSLSCVRDTAPHSGCVHPTLRKKPSPQCSRQGLVVDQL